MTKQSRKPASIIRTLSLQDFQGFRGRHTFDLAPLTLIMGANATGKSSTGRAIKLVAQSADGHLKYSGSNVDLVDRNHATFGQRQNASHLEVQMAFNLLESHFLPYESSNAAFRAVRYGEDEEHWGSWAESFSQVFSKKQIRFLARHVNTLLVMAPEPNSEGEGFSERTVLATGFAFTANPSVPAITIGFGYSVTAGVVKVTAKMEDALFLGYLAPADYESVEQAESLLDPSIEQWFETVFTRMIEIEPVQENSYREQVRQEMLDDVHLEWSTLLLKYVKYLEANGWVADFDQMYFDDETDLRLIFLGTLFDAARSARVEALSDFLEISSVRSANSLPKSLLGDGVWSGVILKRAKDELDLEEVNRALGSLTASRYEVCQADVVQKTMVTSQSSKEIFVLDKLTGARISFDNVGAGLGQILPILRAIFDRPSGKKLLIEQPELHLHPKAQAEFGSILVDALQKGVINQVIVETHSEALLLRVQKLIREGKLQAQDVAVLITQEEPVSEVDRESPRGNMVYNIGLADDGELLEPLELSFASIRLDEYL